MTVPDAQLSSIHAEFGLPTGGWRDSHDLERLVNVVHEHGALLDVAIYRVVEEGRDIFLVSVRASASVCVHSAPTDWRDVRPEPGGAGVDAVRHVLEWLDEVAAGVRSCFLGQIAEIVSAALMPASEGDAGA